MDDDLEAWATLGVAGSLATSYAQDARNFLPLLASVLGASLPAETEIERKGGLFQKQKPIHKISVTLGDQIYTLEDAGRGLLAAHRVKIVRGITLKTEPMPVEDWLAELSAEITARAGQSEKAYFALRDLLG